MSTNNLNYYQIIGVSLDATQEEIKKAYRKRIIRTHPDVNPAPDAHIRAKELIEAYEILNNPETRAAYDKILNKQRSASQQEEERFKQAQQSAKEEAYAKSQWSTEEILASVYEAVKEAGTTVMVGNAKDVSMGDYIRSGFIGLLLVIAIILSFTGFATIPAFVLIGLIFKGVRRGEDSIGIGRLLMSTLGVGVVVILVLFVLAMSILSGI